MCSAKELLKNSDKVPALNKDDVCSAVAAPVSCKERSACYPFVCAPVTTF